MIGSVIVPVAVRLDKQRKRVADILARHGLTYRPGGTIWGEKTAAPTRTLEGMLRARDLTAVDVEFQIGGPGKVT